MMELGDGYISISFGEYGSKDDMEISEDIKNWLDSNLDVYKEDVDYCLFTQRGDDIPNGIEIYNLEMLKHNDFRRLLNYFTYTVERG
tara:strand:+ start:237 stop:497 length:261 start_codon:yes stop_codon:yes gene_type:complete